MRAVFILFTVFAASACVPTTEATVTLPGGEPRAVPISVARALQVTQRMEPVAESICRSRTPNQNCDFEILVNRDPRLGVNAFQTVNPESGRPVVILTVGLIAAVRNEDELAFVIGHEAAHHIAQHIPQQRSAAQAGARVFGAAAQQQGASREEIIEAAGLGALVGARQFSQGAELEADVLGTIITCQAGYDPVRGAAFFGELPDPGEGLLRTHPPNSERVQAVRRTAAQRC